MFHSCSRILLDTGDVDQAPYTDALTDVLTTENASIGTILLTHWHHDHIGGVRHILPMLSSGKILLN